MIRPLNLFLAFVFHLSTAHSQSVELKKSDYSEKCDALLNECIEYNECVGVVAGISKNDSTIWLGSAGSMDVENEISIDNTMLLRIASLAKPMTALAVLQLYQNGLLDLDDEIQKYLPKFPSKEEGPITIRHLLQHTSGIGAYANYEESASLIDYPTLDDALSIFKERPLLNTPGTNYYYSSYGYVILGVIIEKVSGLSFRDYMKENIWDKADMQNTDVEIFGKAYPNKSKLYAKNRYGGFVLDRVTNLSGKLPAGGFYSTTDDMLKFGNAILQNKLIKPSTLDVMTKSSGIKKHGNPYALGWFLYGTKDGENGRVIGHTGSQSGTSSFFKVFLDLKIVVITISNTAEANNSVIDLTNKLTDNLIHPKKIPAPLKSRIDLLSLECQEYLGKFMGEGRIIHVFLENNVLNATLDGRFKSQLFPMSKDHFFIRWGDIDYTFYRDSVNHIVRLTVNENEHAINYSKIIKKPSLAEKIRTSIEHGDMNTVCELLDQKYANNFEPESGDLIDLGFELISSNNYELAITYFTALSERFPEELEIYEGLGAAQLALGENEIAKSMFEKAAPLRAEDGFYQLSIAPKTPYKPTEIPVSPEKLFEYRGDLNNSNVFVFLQGGPSPFLSIDNKRDPFYELSNREDLLRVYPYQSQMMNSSVFSPQSTLSYEDALYERHQSAKIIFQTIEYFKQQGKKVYLFAHSFGSQLTLEFLEHQSNNADGIVLMGTRLNNCVENYPDLPPGKLIRWDRGLRPFVSTWHNEYPALPLIQREFYQVISNTKQLVKVHWKKKFSSILENKKMDNITFVHAKFDEASGRQLDSELNFLLSKGVKLIGTYGDHHSMLSNEYFSHFVNSILENDPIRPSLAYELSIRIEIDGLEFALDWFQRVDKKSHLIIESELNALGYDLLAANLIKEAIEVFKINTVYFPNSWNVYDSLGEAYVSMGELELGKANYKKSLWIRPTSNSGIEALKKLEKL